MPVATLRRCSVPGFSVRLRRNPHQRASGYDVNRIRFKNPFIRFTIVSKHQDRHLLQAEHVKQAVDFPKP